VRLRKKSRGADPASQILTAKDRIPLPLSTMPRPLSSNWPPGQLLQLTPAAHDPLELRNKPASPDTTNSSQVDEAPLHLA